MQNASWAEIVWTVGGLIGLVCNLVLTRIAVNDLQRLKRSKLNGLRMLVAKGNRTNEFYRVLKQTCLFVFGVTALFTPPSPGVSSDHVTLLGVVLTVVLVVVEALLVLEAVQDLQRRRELIKKADELEAARHAHDSHEEGRESHE